jgi:hypothetical protein
MEQGSEQSGHMLQFAWIFWFFAPTWKTSSVPGKLGRFEIRTESKVTGARPGPGVRKRHQGQKSDPDRKPEEGQMKETELRKRRCILPKQQPQPSFHSEIKLRKLRLNKSREVSDRT